MNLCAMWQAQCMQVGFDCKRSLFSAQCCALIVCQKASEGCSFCQQLRWKVAVQGQCIRVVACQVHASGFFKCKLNTCRLWLELVVLFALVAFWWRAKCMQVGNGKAVCIANQLAKIAVVWRWLVFQQQFAKNVLQKIRFCCKIMLYT